MLPLWGNLDEKACGTFAMMAGGAGVVGLTFTLHRTLWTFTILSWLVSIFSVAAIVVHVINRELNPLQWTFWLVHSMTALPAAIFSTMMHVLRVWSGPRPLVEQRAPLVPAEVPPAGEAGAAALAAAVASECPIWPPPNAASLTLGSDLLATAPAASDRAVARPVWPPPARAHPVV